MFNHHSEFVDCFGGLAGQRAPALGACALLQLAWVCEQLLTLARSEVVFLATDTWRTFDERPFEGLGLSENLSVWVEDAEVLGLIDV